MLIKLVTLPYKILTGFILNTLFGILMIDFKNVEPIGSAAELILNLFLIYLLLSLIERLTRKIYKPEFYQKGKMTILNVIERNVLSGAKDKPLYDDDDYQTRYNYELNLLTTVISFITYFLLLSITFMLTLIFYSAFGLEPFFYVNYLNILPVLSLFFGYLIIYYVIFNLGYCHDKHIKPSFIELFVTVIMAIIFFALGLTNLT